LNTSRSIWGKNIYNVTTLAGDNGSGKTTILNCVIGLMLSDYRNDVERTHLKGSEGENWLGIFFAYEQYKRVKYVFDKKAVCHIEAPERAGISRPCASKGDGHDGIGGCEDGAVRRERRSAA
jgi:ABC-type molybdate transport system, ATPase component